MVTRKMQLVQNRKEMRKTVILLLALTLVVTSIGAAAAKGKLWMVSRDSLPTRPVAATSH